MPPPLRPIDPKSKRWEPTEDPNDIVVPGLDTNTTLNEQLEQIEQLITIKLQNVDANFSKIQQIMSNRILPAVKRYAVETESVRDAAKFWITFFEQAAQIRVPTSEEYIAPEDSELSAGDDSLSQETSALDASLDQIVEPSRAIEHSVASSEVSFAPGQAAVSSTPARYKTPHIGDEPTPSWSASIESPMVRLDRDLQSLAEEDPEDMTDLQDPVAHEYTIDDTTQRQIPTAAIPQSETRKGKSPAAPLLRGVLLRNADASAVADRTATAVSPLKVKQKTPSLKSRNPYLPPDTKPSDWKGVVDLSDPRVTTPGKRATTLRRDALSRQASSSKRPSTPPVDDESFDEGLGLSPPIMMDFARLPKAKTPQLGRTPKKEAAARIVQNLMSAGTTSSSFSTARINAIFTRPGAGQGTESSMSSVPTPPSLSKYVHPPEASDSLADASLESIMRRVGLDMSGFGADRDKPQSSNTSTQSYPNIPTSVFIPPTTSQLPPPQSQTQSQLQPDSRMPVMDFSRVRLDDDEEFDPANASMDSEDSFDQANNTANPSAAFIMAAQQPTFNDEDDDSFDSNQDSIDFGDNGGMENPLANMIGAQEDDSFDDSFDNDPIFDQQTEEETLFGVAPAQRIAAHRAYESRVSMGGNLRLHGQELLEDTLGIGAQMAQTGRVDGTPTPWGAGREH